MAVIKGQNLRLTLDGKIVAAATSCQLHIAANLEDASTKDTEGGWQKQECTGKSWDLSTDALVVVDASETGLVAFDAAEMVGQEIDITVDLTEGAQNRQLSAGVYTGKAIVNDFSLTAGNRANSTYTVQAQGNGALTRVTES